MSVDYRMSFYRDRPIPSMLLVISLLAGPFSLRLEERAIAQMSDQPMLTVEQTAELAEAKQLAQQVEQLIQRKKYYQALFLTERISSIQRKVLGGKHPEVIATQIKLADLYAVRGEWQNAIDLLASTLSIQEQTLGLEHPEIALTLNKISRLIPISRSFDAPSLALSASILHRALAIQEKTLGTQHPNVATTLTNLARVSRSQEKYAQAEALYLRALSIREQTLEPEHPDVASSLYFLAAFYQNRQNDAQAISLHQRGLTIREKALGAMHPDVADSLSALAELYIKQKRYAQAEPLLQRALAIQERTFGIANALFEENHRTLTLLNWAEGNISRAAQLLTQSIDINETRVARGLTFGSDSDKRLTTASLTTINYTVSLHLHNAPNDLPAVRLSLTSILRDKGRILDILTNSIRTLRQNPTAVDLALFNQLTAVRSQIATLSLNQPTKLSPEQYRNQLLTLKSHERYLENLLILRSGKFLDPEEQAIVERFSLVRAQLTELSLNRPVELSPEQYQDQLSTLTAQSYYLEGLLLDNRSTFRFKTEPVTVNNVQQLIPANTALIELVQYEPYNPKAILGEQWWGKTRYAAYILSHQGEPIGIDLGEAEPIDQLVENFRQALRTRESDVKQTARKLDAVLMQPIRQKLGNAKKLLISPDSQLNLIPFSALVDEQNRYLVENYEITYLTSGRDLLRLQNNVTSRQPPILIANPDYAHPGNPTSTQILRKGGFSNPLVAITANSSIKPAPIGNNARGNNQRSSDLFQLRFTPLPGTAEEAKAIAPKLPNVTLLTGTEATENALKQVQAPKILHIATHGFFLEDIPLVTSNSRGTDSLSRSDIEPTIEPSFRPPNRAGNTENTLLRSGLALAGFNPRKSDTEDGVLTALEAAGLDLRGTQLVVLSACETGVGDVANGEGVYGLRRAFVIAGAESQLISLWKIDDTGTKDLMVQYYDRLLANSGRSDALRQTQLEFLKSSRYQHPYYWAAFIPSGDWHKMNN